MTIPSGDHEPAHFHARKPGEWDVSKPRPKAGIYKITHQPSGEFYIGQSADIETRWNQHRLKLLYGTHCNEGLGNAYAADGPDSLVYEVVEWCNPRDLAMREGFYILRLKPTFNMAPPCDAALLAFKEDEQVVKGDVPKCWHSRKGCEKCGCYKPKKDRFCRPCKELFRLEMKKARYLPGLIV